MLETNDWDWLGRDALNKLGGIVGKYFGRGEYVSGFCPKIISYQESIEAQRALDSVVTYIRGRLENKKYDSASKLMNEKQKRIQEMVIELTQAMEKYGSSRKEIDHVIELLPGIMDGSFFSLPEDFHISRLGWLNGAFFGRGERATPLFSAGLLRDDFDLDFNINLKEYAKSKDFFGGE
jgi:hypothetical protein